MHSKHPAWAPDGKRIAYVQGGKLFVLDPNALPDPTITQITNAGLNAAQPTWSSDGLQLAFEGDYQGVRAVYTANVFEGNVFRLTDDGMSPKWRGLAGQTARCSVIINPNTRIHAFSSPLEEGAGGLKSIVEQLILDGVDPNSPAGDEAIYNAAMQLGDYITTYTNSTAWAGIDTEWGLDFLEYYLSTSSNIVFVQRWNGSETFWIAFVYGLSWKNNIDCSSSVPISGFQPTPTPTPTGPTPTPTPTSTGPAPTPTPTITPTLAPSGCTLTIQQAGANIRRGPSTDDLVVQSGNTTGGLPFPIYAKAYGWEYDIQGALWYGILHDSRLNDFSWVAASTVSSTNPIDCAGITLPDESLQYNPDWDDWNSKPQIERYPLDSAAANPLFYRGFGIDDPIPYQHIAYCAHPGQDFVPDTGDITVYAVASGIIVGIGQADVTEPERINAWGSTDGGYSVIVRTGGHFVLYGHLGTIPDAFFIGVPVQVGDVIGTLGNPDNLHGHIEIRTFTFTQNQVILQFLRPEFGAINAKGPSNPLEATDPMYFVPVTDRGIPSGTSASVPTVCNPSPYGYESFTGASLPDQQGTNVTFNYIVRINNTNAQGGISQFKLRCFRLDSGADLDPDSCITSQPPQ